MALNSVETSPAYIAYVHKTRVLRAEHNEVERSDKEMSHGDIRMRIHNEVMVSDRRKRRSQKLPKERIACEGNLL